MGFRVSTRNCAFRHSRTAKLLNNRDVYVKEPRAVRLDEAAEFPNESRGAAENAAGFRQASIDPEVPGETPSRPVAAPLGSVIRTSLKRCASNGG